MAENVNSIFTTFMRLRFTKAFVVIAEIAAALACGARASAINSLAT
jgi:hypothetical protein